MSRLTRDGTAEPISRDQILRHARGQGDILFPVQLTTSRIGNLTRLIHTLPYVMTIHTYLQTQHLRCNRRVNIGFLIGAVGTALGVVGSVQIDAALKRLKLPTITPGATSTLSASSASLFLLQFSDAFSSSLTHEAINLQPPSRTMLYQTPGQCLVQRYPSSP